MSNEDRNIASLHQQHIQWPRRACTYHVNSFTSTMDDLETRQASAHIYAGTGAALTRENGCGGRRTSSNAQSYAFAVGTDTASGQRTGSCTKSRDTGAGLVIRLGQRYCPVAFALWRDLGSFGWCCFGSTRRFFVRDFSFLSNAAILIRCQGRIRPTRYGIDVDKRTELSEYGNVLLLSQLALDLTG